MKNKSKNNKQKKQKSSSSSKSRYSIRTLYIGLLIVIVAIISLFVSAFYIFIQDIRDIVKNESTKIITTQLSLIISEIDNELGKLEVALDNTTSFVENTIEKANNNPDLLYSTISKLLLNNPKILGSTVAFRANYFPQKGEWFAPYVHYFDGHISYTQLGNENYNYFYWDWYQIPFLLKSSYWSDTYYDTGGGEAMMTTYSKPLFDFNNEVYAIYTADIKLDIITAIIQNRKPYKNSSCFLIGRNGSFIYHPEEEYVLNETMYTISAYKKDTTERIIGREMVAGMQGMRSVMKEDGLYYIFYAPIDRLGWSVGIECRDNDVYEALDEISALLFPVSVAGLLLLLVFFITVVRQTTLNIKKMNISMRTSGINMYVDSSVNHSNIIKDEKLGVNSLLRKIKFSNFPKNIEDHPNFNISVSMLSAADIGGNLYDYFEVGDDLYLCIGNISGSDIIHNKDGISVATCISVICNLFRALATNSKQPAEICATINEVILMKHNAELNVSFFVGKFNSQTRELKYCNAGHTSPLLISSVETSAIWTRKTIVTAVEMPAKQNLKIGAAPSNYLYLTDLAKLGKKSILVFYTAGLFNLKNNEKFYTAERLEALLLKNRDISKKAKKISSSKIVENIIEDVVVFSEDAGQKEEITILVITLQDSETS